MAKSLLGTLFSSKSNKANEFDIEYNQEPKPVPDDDLWMDDDFDVYGYTRAMYYEEVAKKNGL